MISHLDLATWFMFFDPMSKILQYPEETVRKSMHCYIQCVYIYIYILSANMSDIVIYLLPNIGIGICPNNPISVGPYP